MTIDEIVEEFREKHCIKKDGCYMLNPTEKSTILLEHFIKQKLTEAERKGKEKAYQYIGTLSKLRMAMFNSINKKEKAKAFEQTWRDCLNEYKKLKELEKK